MSYSNAFLQYQFLYNANALRHCQGTSMRPAPAAVAHLHLYIIKSSHFGVIIVQKYPLASSSLLLRCLLLSFFAQLCPARP
jgi:hypothetical protein